MTKWRTLCFEDGDRLSALDAACRNADGHDPISHPVTDALKAVRDDAQNTYCAESQEGEIIAAGWINLLEGLRLSMGGKVHPDFRRCGLGNRLLEWAENRAGELVQSRNSMQLVITNESLREEAQRLYMRRGFEQVMVEEMHVFDLARPIPAVNFPEGVGILPWSSNTTALFFQAYHDSFQDRPGFPGQSAEEWITGNLEFEGFRSDLSLLAGCANEPVGFLTADAFSGLGWISQMGVVPALRRKGLAKALIAEVLHRFKEEGFKQVALHVNVNNSSAIDLYSHVGFVYRLKRARYLKGIKSPSNRDLA